jgi:hypothetical protein
MAARAELWSGLWLMLIAMAPGYAQSEGEDPATELDPIVVTPRVNPLDESLDRLREMMEQAPCLGCEVKLRESPAESFVNFVLFKAQPPNPDFEQRLESRLADDWRVAERGPEMESFR